MDLITAKVEAAKLSKGGKTVFIVQDSKDETELVTTSKHPGDPQKVFVAFRNGSEVAIPEAPEKAKAEKVVAAKASKEKKEPKVKTNKKVETEAKKRPTKKVVAKKDRVAVTGADAVKRLVANGAKKVKMSVKKALEKSKTAYLYRASNGSPLGKYYLAEYKDKEKELEFLVKES